MMPDEEDISPLPRTVIQVRSDLEALKPKVAVLRADVDLVKAAVAGVHLEFEPGGRVAKLEDLATESRRILLGEYDKETNTVRPGVVQTNEALVKGQAKLVSWGLPMLAVVALCAVILVCLVIFQPSGAGTFGSFLHGLQKG